MHAWGNYLVVPFNAENKEDVDLKRFTDATTFFENLKKKTPSGSIMGNGATTVDYTANGEASDWMLG